MTVGIGAGVSFGGARGSVASRLAMFNPTNVVAASFTDNTLIIRDSVTPANNYEGALIDPGTGLFNKLTFSAAGTRYSPNVDGTWSSVSSNVPVIADAPYGKAFLVDGATTNLIATNPSAPSTQSATVTATAHTLSFTGTGSITLSGASTAGPLVGTGATTRVQLQFTPSAGSLTMTVAGNVRFAKLEARAWASRYSEGVTVADSCSIPNTVFNLSTAAGTLYVRNTWDGGSALGANARDAIGTYGSAAEWIAVYNNTGASGVTFRASGVSQANMVGSAVGANILTKSAAAYAANDFAFCQDGGSVSTDAAGSTSATTSIDLGCFSANSAYLFGGISEFAFFGSRLTNAQLQALTS